MCFSSVYNLMQKRKGNDHCHQMNVKFWFYYYAILLINAGKTKTTIHLLCLIHSFCFHTNGSHLPLLILHIQKCCSHECFSKYIHRKTFPMPSRIHDSFYSTQFVSITRNCMSSQICNK